MPKYYYVAVFKTLLVYCGCEPPTTSNKRGGSQRISIYVVMHTMVDAHILKKRIFGFMFCCVNVKSIIAFRREDYGVCIVQI